MIGQVEIKLFKERLSLVQVLVVCPDHKWFTAALEPVTPFSQSPNDGQLFTVSSTESLLSGVKLLRMQRCSFWSGSG